MYRLKKIWGLGWDYTIINEKLNLEVSSSSSCTIFIQISVYVLLVHYYLQISNFINHTAGMQKEKTQEQGLLVYSPVTKHEPSGDWLRSQNTKKLPFKCNK